MRTESQILSAMAKASTLAEQTALAAELETLRNTRREAAQEARDLAWADMSVKQAMTPVVPWSHHVAQDDWLDEAADIDTENADAEMVAEAHAWVGRVHASVKADATEFRHQAVGAAQSLAGRYGGYADEAQRQFLLTVQRLAGVDLGVEASSDCGCDLCSSRPGEVAANARETAHDIFGFDSGAVSTNEEDAAWQLKGCTSQATEMVWRGAFREAVQELSANWAEDEAFLNTIAHQRTAMWDEDYDSDLYHDSRDPGVWYDKAIDDVEMGRPYSPPKYDQEAIWAYEGGWEDAEGPERHTATRKIARNPAGPWESVAEKFIGKVDGYDVWAYVVPDEDTHPSDYGPDSVYDDAEVMDAYERGDWEFVGLIVQAELDGEEEGSFALWGIESGHFPGEARRIDPLEDREISSMVREAVDDAKRNGRTAARKGQAARKTARYEELIGRQLMGFPGSEILDAWSGYHASDEGWGGYGAWALDGKGAQMVNLKVRLEDGRVVEMTQAERRIQTFERKASRRTAQGASEGWWPSAPSPTFPGETTLACPACGSVNVTIGGSNLGSDVVRGTEYTSLTCKDCGNSAHFPKRTTRREASGSMVWDAGYDDGYAGRAPREWSDDPYWQAKYDAAYAAGAERREEHRTSSRRTASVSLYDTDRGDRLGDVERGDPNNWRAEYIVNDGSPAVWYTNSVVFTSEEAALDAAYNKAFNWFAVSDYRVVTDDTPLKQSLSETGPGKWG